VVPAVPELLPEPVVPAVPVSTTVSPELQAKETMPRAKKPESRRLSVRFMTTAFRS
jgi:hypothetical protein